MTHAIALANYSNPCDFALPGKASVTIPRSQRGSTRPAIVLLYRDVYDAAKERGGAWWRNHGAHCQIVEEFDSSDVPPWLLNGTRIPLNEVDAQILRLIRVAGFCDWVAEAHHEEPVRRVARQQASGIRAGLIGPEVIHGYRVYGHASTDGGSCENWKHDDLKCSTGEWRMDLIPAPGVPTSQLQVRTLATLNPGSVLSVG